MSDFVFTRQGNVRMACEGVGSYGSAATTAATDFVEVTRDSPGITYTPVYSELDTLTPYRGGQEPVKTDEDINYEYTSRMRAITIPSSDDASRPRNWHPLARGAGAIETYSNNGGGGPYTLTYSWKDHAEVMDSLTIEHEVVEGANDNAITKDADGGRHNLKISATRGGIIALNAVGMLSDYAKTDKGSAANNDATPTSQVMTFQGGTLTLTNIGASLSYSGLVEAFEFDLKMEVKPLKTGAGGTGLGGLVSEIILHPGDAIMWSLTVQEKLLASFNAEKVMTDETILTAALQIPDLSDTDNTVTFNWDGRIVSVEPTLIEGAVSAYKINGVTLWPHASAPGITPTDSFNVVFSTAA